jgi:hypothetical protein
MFVVLLKRLLLFFSSILAILKPRIVAFYPYTRILFFPREGGVIEVYTPSFYSTKKISFLASLRMPSRS